MKSYFRIAIGILIIGFGYKAVRQEFGGHEVGVFSELNYVPIILVILLTVIMLSFETSNFSVARKFYQYIFSFIGLTVCVIVFFKIIQRDSIERSKTVLKVVNKAGANNVWLFDFKEDKHFTLADYNLLGHTIYYGQYERQGDTLKIIESNYDGELKEFPGTGIIKADTVYWDKFDTMLVKKE